MLTIQWTHGYPHEPEAGIAEARARIAALKVLGNVDPGEAAAEYERQVAENPDEPEGIARLWIDAQHAADLALKEGWHDPNGAGCTIMAG